MNIRSLLVYSVLVTGCFHSVLTSTLSGQEAPQLFPMPLGSTRNSHACGDLFMGGQFTPADIERLQEFKIGLVINLRLDRELDWDEKGSIEQAEIRYVSIPVGAPDTLTDEVVDKVRELLGEAESPVLLHCGSGIRVAAAWVPYRVLDQGVSTERALEEAKSMGLGEGAYREKAIDYITRKQERQPELSANPGINQGFLNPELDVDSYIDRFEVESREVFSARAEVLEAIGVQAGDRVADVGAGTGIYTRLFSRQVGPDGWVFAVDIAAPFIQHINQTAQELGLENISGVLCRENSIALPANSVDVVFICDTYHHFEYPRSTLHSINQALAEGGSLIVIDFERIPGQTREWLMNHVRAGKEVFREEIEAAGFKFVEEVKIDGFEENYLLKFEKH